MKNVATAWLVFLVFSAALFAGVEDDPPNVSIIKLIAAPKDFAHKVVRVIGYLSIEFEGDAIYLHEEDYKHSLTANALSVKAKPEMLKRLEKLNRQYVIIEGVFDPSANGHMGLFSGGIIDISRADPSTSGLVSAASPK